MGNNKTNRANKQSIKKEAPYNTSKSTVPTLPSLGGLNHISKMNSIVGI